MFAPSRTSSLTWRKRRSKIVSVMIDVPEAWVMRTMNWACMSVGKPGKGRRRDVLGEDLGAADDAQESRPRVSMAAPE